MEKALRVSEGALEGSHLPSRIAVGFSVEAQGPPPRPPPLLQDIPIVDSFDAEFDVFSSERSSSQVSHSFDEEFSVFSSERSSSQVGKSFI